MQHAKVKMFVDNYNWTEIPVDFDSLPSSCNVAPPSPAQNLSIITTTIAIIMSFQIFLVVIFIDF